MRVTLSGRTMVPTVVLQKKALSPMAMTELGIVIFVRFVHASKVSSPMAVMLVLRETLRNPHPKEGEYVTAQNKF